MQSRKKKLFSSNFDRNAITIKKKKSEKDRNVKIDAKKKLFSSNFDCNAITIKKKNLKRIEM